MTSVFDLAIRARGLGFASANFSALINPMLMYQLTHSLSLAGLSLILEWLPKLSVYLYGASWIEQFHARRMHRTLEVMRLMAFVFLALVAFHVLPWWGITLSGILFQSANALSNLLFERNTQHWSIISTQHTYTSLLRADLLGSLSATVVSMMVPSMHILIGIAMAFQMTVMIITYRYSKRLYQHTEHQPRLLRTWVQEEVTTPFRLVQTINGSVLRYLIISMSLNLPVALVFTQMPFFLNHAYGTTIDNQFFGMINFWRILTGFLYMQAMTHASSKGHDRRWQILSMVLFGVSLMGLFGNHHLFVVAMIAMGISFYGITPWLRSLRQREIQKHPEGLAITGILIAMDAFVYLFAGMVAMLPVSIPMMLAISITIVVIGVTVSHRTLAIPTQA